MSHTLVRVRAALFVQVGDDQDLVVALVEVLVLVLVVCERGGWRLGKDVESFSFYAGANSQTKWVVSQSWYAQIYACHLKVIVESAARGSCGMFKRHE